MKLWLVAGFCTLCGVAISVTLAALWVDHRADDIVARASTPAPIQVGGKLEGEFRLIVDESLRARQAVVPGLDARGGADSLPPDLFPNTIGSVQYVREPAQPKDRIGPEAQVKDVLEGPIQRAYYGNGQLWYEGSQVKNDLGQWEREGNWEAWHENGALHELGMYRRDEEHGVWKWWYDNASPMAVGSFDEGKRIGEWEFWYESGGKMMNARYENGEGAGLWTHFHENGRKKAEGEYIDGVIAGYWTIWDENGAIIPERTGYYEDGEKVRD